MKEIWEDIKKPKFIGTRSKNDRYTTRKFSCSISTIKKSFNEFNSLVDSEYCHGLLDKVIASSELAKYTNGKFDRYDNYLKKDVFYLSTMLGINEDVNFGKYSYFAVYDLGKVHHVALGAILGLNPEKVRIGIMNYLDRIGVTFGKYLNYIIDGIKSDIIERGFSIYSLINELGNSYLNVKRLADDIGVSVTEFIRLSVIKFNENLFEEFMYVLENKSSDNDRILVQSVGLDTLMISSINIKVFDRLEVTLGQSRWYVKPEIFNCSEFNEKIPKYYLNRKVVA